MKKGKKRLLRTVLSLFMAFVLCIGSSSVAWADEVGTQTEAGNTSGGTKDNDGGTAPKEDQKGEADKTASESGDDSQKASDTKKEADSQTEAEKSGADNTAPGDQIPAKEKSADRPRLMTAPDGYGVQNATSKIGGVSFVNTGNSSQLALTTATPESGTINVKFPAGTTDGEVRITMPQGVSWNYEGDTNGMGTVSALTGQTIYNWNDEYKMGDGTYVYHVQPNSTEFAITNLKVEQCPIYAGRTFTNTTDHRIVAEVWYGGALKDKVYIDNIDLKEKATAFAGLYQSYDLFTAVNGEVKISTVQGADTAYKATALVYKGGGFSWALTESVKVKVKPISINSGSDMTKGVMDNKNPDWSVSADGSGAYTFTATNIGIDDIQQPQFTIHYPGTDFAAGDKIVYEVHTEIQFVDGLVLSPDVPDKNFSVRLVPDQSELTVNVATLNDAVVNNKTTQDLSFDAKFGKGTGSNGYLGMFYVGNKGGKNSGPTKVSLDFDSTDIGVRYVRIALPFVDNGGTNLVNVNSVYYTTNQSGQRQYTGAIHDEEDNSAHITASMLGLGAGEYLTNLTYELSTVPATKISLMEVLPVEEYIYRTSCSFYGDILKYNNGSPGAVNTLTLTDTSNSQTVTGKITTNTSSGKGGAFVDEGVKNYQVTSGDTETVSIDITGEGGFYGSTQNPIIYIRNITEAIIDLDSIVLKDIHGNVIDNDDLIITKYTNADPQVKEIVKIDTKNITDGSVTINSQDAELADISWLTKAAIGGTLNLKVDFEVPVYAQTNTTLWKDMLFVEDPTVGNSLSNRGGTPGSFQGDTYNLKTVANGYIVGLPASNGKYFQISGRSDMVITNAVKYTGAADTTYTTYSRDGAHLILDPPTTVDVQMSFINSTGTSGSVKTGTTMYMPVPKEGEDWKSMMDSSHQQFEFSTELTGKVTNPEPGRYDIFYGKVTPTDHFPTLDSYTFEAWNSANASEYNCVKVVQKTDWLYNATDKQRDFVMTLKLSYNDTTDDAQFDIWSPRYHQIYTANGGDYGTENNGELTALTTQLGQITGSLWLDDNLDGVQAATETNLPSGDKNGWKVTLFELSDYKTNGNSATPVDMGNSTHTNPQTTDINGTYFFERLDRTKEYVIVAENKYTNKYGFSIVGSDSDDYKNNTFVGSANQSEGVSGAAAIKVKAARLVKNTGAGQENEAKKGIYPIGLRNPISKTAKTPESATGVTGKIGSTITYTIDYMNTEASAATITIKDEVPAYTSFVSATGNPGTKPAVGDLAGSQIEWTLANVPSGQSGSVTFTVKVLPTALNVDITNTAEVKVGSNSPVTTNTVHTKVNGATATTSAVTKAITGNPPLPAQNFSFKIEGKKGTEPMPAATTKSITGAGTISPSFGSITFDAADTYTYYIKETAGSTPGYTYDTKVYIWTVNVTADGSGNLTAATDLKVKAKAADNDTTATTASAVTFTNKYAVTPTTAISSPAVKKSLSGATPPSKQQFNFTLTADVANPTGGVTGLSTSQNISGAGTASDAFGSNVVFSKEGTYKFTIAETAGTANGYTYDNETYLWEVKVEDKNSQLTVTSNKLTKKSDSSTATEAVFTNDYQVLSDTYTVPTVTKTLTGDVPPSKATFTFTIAGDTGTEPMPAQTSITTTGAGTATFGSITYTAAGTYVYHVKETQGSSAGYTYSSDVYDITVTVTDKGNQLEAAGVVKKSGANASAITFSNKYTLTQAAAIGSPDVKKSLSGSTPPGKQQFSFTLTADSANPAGGVTGLSTSKSITGAGTASDAFGSGIVFSKVGTYKFTIAETAGTANGYTYDTETYLWEVKVEDKNSQLTVTSNKLTKKSDSSAATEALFTNDYQVLSDTYTVPTVTKTLTGDVPATKAAFTFTIAGDKGTEPMPAQTSITTSGAGTAAFGSITYSKAGTYVYHVKETQGSSAGYTYSTDVYDITVTVTDKGNQLQAAGEVKKNGANASAITFSNKYTLTPAAAIGSPTVKKAISGAATPEDKKFTFTMTPDAANPAGGATGAGTSKIITGTGTASDAFGDKIVFTKAGTYKFTIIETAGSDSGYTYDTETYLWEVKVEDKNSQLTVTSNKLTKVSDSSTAAEALFTNEYKVAATAYTVPTVNKTITGASPSKPEKFTFTITGDKGTEPMPAKTSITTNGAGTAAFGTIDYSAAGTYVYQIKETRGNNAGYTYSTDVYTLTVKVTDTNAQLYADGIVTKNNASVNDITFANKYTQTPVKINPEIIKKISGKKPAKASTFNFRISAVTAAAPMPADAKNGAATRKITGSGKKEIGSITFTKPGTYEYKIQEVAGSDKAYTYDSTVYTMTVTVTDDGKGNLSSKVVYKNAKGKAAASLTFTNKYKKTAVDPSSDESKKNGSKNGSGKNGSVKSGTNSNGVKTGDTSKAGLFIALLALSAAALGVVLFIRRRRREQV